MSHPHLCMGPQNCRNDQRRRVDGDGIVNTAGAPGGCKGRAGDGDVTANATAIRALSGKRTFASYSVDRTSMPLPLPVTLFSPTGSMVMGLLLL